MHVARALLRKFKATYGETPYSYLMTRRIERAKALLRQGVSVTDACVAVGAHGQEMNIVRFPPHGGLSQEDGDGLMTLVTKDALQVALFTAEDLDATFEKARTSGAEVLQEPAAPPWGVRDCASRDPSGNMVRIAQA